MDHVTTTVPEPFPLEGGRIRVHAIPVWQDNYAWLLVDAEAGRAAVVDGPEAGPVLDACARLGVVLDTVLITHHHPDHVGILRDLEAQGRLGDLRVVGPAALAEHVPGLSEPVDEGDTVAWGPLRLAVWRTDGHVTGHVTYVADGAVFCGDTLFAGGCGYLFDGPPEAMLRSLLRLAALPGETRVCCAHEYTQDNLRFAWTVEPGSAALAARIRAVWALRARGVGTVPSTLEAERATNPFLRPGAPEALAKLRARWPERPLDTAAERFAAVRAWKDTGEHKVVDDADLPLTTG